MLLNRSSSEYTLNNFNHNKNYSCHNTEVAEVDMEREIQLMHSHLFDYFETLCHWKNLLEHEQNALLYQFPQQNYKQLHNGQSSISNSVSAPSLAHLIVNNKSTPLLMSYSARSENGGTRNTEKSIVVLPLEKLFHSAVSIFIILIDFQINFLIFKKLNYS